MTRGLRAPALFGYPPLYPGLDRSWLRAVRAAPPVEPRTVDPRTPPYLCRLLTRQPALDPAPAVPVGFREAGQWAVNTSDLRFGGVPGCTALGVDITTPAGRRLWTVPLLEPQTVPAGSVVLIPAGVLVLALADYLTVGG